MKKISLLTLLFLAGILNSFGQNPIPNPSFENWTTYISTGGCPSGPYQIPNYWQTSDSAYCAASFGSSGHSAVQELVDKCDLNYAIKLTTISALGNIGPGVATNGTITGISSVGGGSTDTLRSSNFTGCYVYLPASNDTGFISAVLLKWNFALVKRDTIALARMLLTSSVSSVTNFSIPFVYQILNTNPDTILVVLASSQGFNHGVAGSILKVDNLNVSGINGIEGNSVLKNVEVFPSPASSELNINITYSNFKKTLYNLSDATGRIVMSGTMSSTKEKLNTSSLSNGIYMLTLHDDAGEKLYSTKVTVIH